jgi:hypothetical protein
MKFSDLYNFSNKLDTEYTSVNLLIEEVKKRHNNVDDVELYPVDIDAEISFGHIKFRTYVPVPYAAIKTVASIRFDKKRNRCWRRLIVCKELMHVFDSSDEIVDTEIKFKKLMSEFDSPPLSADSSPMYQSELRAQWMAISCLVPARLKQFYTEKLLTGAMSDYEIALKLKIPQDFVPSFVNPYYDVVLKKLLE